MQINVNKVIGNAPKHEFQAVDLMIKAQQDVLEALHIFQSTIENWDDKDILELNKERMIKYFDKFSVNEPSIFESLAKDLNPSSGE